MTKNVPSSLQSHLDTRVTTVCYCWKVTRADGTVQGFTNHDNDLTVNSQVYRASSGFAPTEITQSLGLNVGNLEVEGALSNATINEDALALGEYDNADVEILLVNWSDVSQYLTIFKGSVGEVKRMGGTAFQAEIRSQAHNLNQKTGRTYQYYCDADLGDSRCGIDLSSSTYTGTGSVSAADSARTFVATGLSGYTDGWFRGGKVTFTSGSNNGKSFEVKVHLLNSSTGAATIELWQEAPNMIGATDTFSISAGCDKDFATCKAKFSNATNFQGFPFIPGNDTVHSYPTQGEGSLDGGSLFGN